MSEHDEQAALIDWAKLNESLYPGLELLYANPLGGKRAYKTAKALKREGVKAGIPDLTLPVARGDYHGAYLEMKYGRNTPTERQVWWLEALKAQGFFTAICWSFEEARDVIIAYLEGRV